MIDSKSKSTSKNSQLHVFYLHGFASSPSSLKAIRFKNMLTEYGASVEIPDLNFPTFREMTLSYQIDLVEKQINQLPGGAPVILIGSSMGGLLASVLSQRVKQISALVLLAPGFGIARRWKEFLNEEEYEIWKVKGAHSFYHHAHDAFMPLGYDFARDLQSMKTEDIIIDLPCLVFHGEHDKTVPIEESQRFASLNKTVDLRILDDDHQLLNSLDQMLGETQQFLRVLQLVQL
ncbi:MAG: alpha/beta fold hydrolase [Candidatus Melainabacteria bacterium]|nr:alpha/beta fold hydrolase [Candidatus Melainabacteria bacterium]